MASSAQLPSSVLPPASSLFRCITLGDCCCLDTEWLLDRILKKEENMPDVCPACKGNGSICTFDTDVRDVVNGIK